MNRFTKAALAGAVAAGFALPQAHAIGGVQVQAKDYKFNFGISMEVVASTSENLDLDDRKNASSPNTGPFSSVGTTGDSRGGELGTETRWYFKLQKDRVEAYILMEWDAGLDETSIDANDPNVERIRLTLDLPEMSSKLDVGADILVADTVARHIYLDDDPMIRLRGAKDNLTWQLAWNLRRERSGRVGDSGGVATGGQPGLIGDGSDHSLLSARFQIKGKTAGGSSWMIEPGVIYQNRNITQALSATDSEQNTAYFWLGGDFTAGIARFRVQGAYNTGDISGLTPAGAAASPFPTGGDDMDISAYAVHASIQLDLSKTGWPLGGVKPYFAWDFMSGDDDVTDDDLEGFTAITTPNQLRWDGAAYNLGRMSAAAHAPTTIGCLCLQFGFETHRLGGGGPTTGGIGEGAFGDNPGQHLFQLGVGGKLNPKWSLNARVLHWRYAEADAMSAAGLAGAMGDEEIGTGFDINLRWHVQKEMYIAPFFSVFVPGDGAENIVGDDATAVLGGVTFYGNF